MSLSKINKNHIDVILNLNNVIFHDKITYSRDYIKKICEQGTGFIVCFDDTIVGYVLCDYYKNELTNETAPTIMSIGVLKEYRGLGLGRMLLRSAIKLYPNKNIYLNVSTKNYNAQKLYNSEGFVVIGKFKNYYNFSTGNEDAYIMVKFYNTGQFLKLFSLSTFF